jgi:hypothetical protein
MPASTALSSADYDSAAAAAAALCMPAPAARLRRSLSLDGGAGEAVKHARLEELFLERLALASTPLAACSVDGGGRLLVSVHAAETCTEEEVDDDMGAAGGGGSGIACGSCGCSGCGVGGAGTWPLEGGLAGGEKDFDEKCVGAARAVRPGSDALDGSSAFEQQDRWASYDTLLAA